MRDLWEEGLLGNCMRVPQALRGHQKLQGILGQWQVSPDLGNRKDAARPDSGLTTLRSEGGNPPQGLSLSTGR